MLTKLLTLYRNCRESIDRLQQMGWRVKQEDILELVRMGLEEKENKLERVVTILKRRYGVWGLDLKNVA